MTEPSQGSLRRVGKSIAKLTAGETINKLTRFAATVLLARTLSVGDFGLVNVGIAISGLLLMLTALGLPEYGAREVAVSPRSVRRVAGLVLFARVGTLAVVSALILLATAAFFPSQLALMVLAATMALGLSTSADWLLRGREQMGDAAAATSLGGIVVLLGCASVVILLPTTTTALAVFALGEIAAAFMTWWQARVGRLKLPTVKRAKRVVRTTWPLGAAGIIIYASYANLDSILLAVIRSDVEAGLYSAPYRLFLAANAVVIFAAYSLLPMLARSHHEGRREAKRHLLLHAFTPLAGYGLAVLGASELLGEFFLARVFGPDFAGTGTVLILLCMSMPIYSIGYPAGYSLIGEQRNWRFFLGGAVAGGLNLALMIALIPPYGIYGAAIATTIGLIGGALVWLMLAEALRSSILLILTLAAITLLGIPAADFPISKLPIGMLTALAGLTMLGVAWLNRAEPDQA